MTKEELTSATQKSELSNGSAEAHAQPLDVLIRVLHTDLKRGLSTEEAQRRL
ncbi:MAG: cation-transporting P-type ATPase, partial [Anaerolineae bacterium]